MVANHIRVFSDQAIQFVFVAGYVPELEHIAIPDFFDAVIELKGLPREHILALFEKTIIPQGFHFEGNAFEEIFSYCQGNPRKAIAVAWDAATISAETNDCVVSERVAQHAIAAAEKLRGSP